MATISKTDEKSQQDKTNDQEAKPQRPPPLSAAYAFLDHYLTSEQREEIGPFTIYPKKNPNTLIFSFPVLEFSDNLESDLRQTRDDFKELKSKTQNAQNGEQRPQTGKAYFVERVRPEFAWRRREMVHLLMAVVEARNAVEMKVQQWEEAEKMIKGILGRLEGMLTVIDKMPEDGDGSTQ